MRPTKPDALHPLPDLVEVFWWDHYSLGDDWHTGESRHEPCILSAVGYVVDQNDMYYWVSSTLEVATGMYSSGTAVLKNCVTHMETLRPARTVSWNGHPSPQRPKRK
jgi:hypothetical protein